ncbi:TrmH family RNA methyltransferase [Tenggerimyces flavus]|uniref:TrmH family RNA methyltransferase n=1 Tax=Tenggerimyces flavus TaxID=1708749 RepID=A0ABV7Y6I6_9ACTN|nr:RNA methyltransferase [Tenggerimyces flavus]MBM7788449.1 tRNA G18 (ribose-2'-O)-methylase SpoU [Tenggerimyces flavus]
MIVPLADLGDPRLADYQRLRDVGLRRSLEAEHGLFIAESEKVIRRAVAAGYEARSFLMAERWLVGLRDLIEDSDAPAFVLPQEQVEQVAGFPIHRGALASMRRKPPTTVAEVTAKARRILVIEDVVDHTNVGIIFRSAAALGIDAIVLSPRCADPLYRRAVKVSMGAVFALPYARLTDWYQGLAELRATGFRLLALTPAADATALEDETVDPAHRLALLLGTEGDGLSSHWLDEADRAVRIPMAAGIDSLNVAAAAAVACYLLGNLRTPG